SGGDGRAHFGHRDDFLFAGGDGRRGSGSWRRALGRATLLDEAQHVALDDSAAGAAAANLRGIDAFVVGDAAGEGRDSGSTVAALAGTIGDGGADQRFVAVRAHGNLVLAGLDALGFLLGMIG